MSIHWQLTPVVGNAEDYDWPKTTTLVDHMRGGYFKVSNLMYFLEHVVGHTIGDPDTLAQAEVLEISQELTRALREAGERSDTDEIDYPASEDFTVTYAQLCDLEATFRFAAEHQMVLIAY